MDTAAGGAFLSVNLRDAIALVEKIASNQSWNKECAQSRKRGGGMHQLTEVDMMSAKMDMLMKKLKASRPWELVSAIDDNTLLP
jgi:hypothetical protein